MDYVGLDISYDTASIALGDEDGDGDLELRILERAVITIVDSSNIIQNL